MAQCSLGRVCHFKKWHTLPREHCAIPIRTLVFVVEALDERKQSLGAVEVIRNDVLRRNGDIELVVDCADNGKDVE